MKVSLNWLKDYVNINCSTHDFCEKMTMAGTKAEGYTELGADIHNVVAGKLVSVEKHPDADQLLVCMVEVGKDAPVQIVTGAPNVKVGDIVPVCLDGAVLPGGKKIKSGKLRGIASQGMLCSLEELGLTLQDFPYAEEDGIFIMQEDCEIGQDIREVLKLSDTLVEFEITFNRPDCNSYIGIARESAAALGTDYTLPAPQNIAATGNEIDNFLAVTVDNTSLCPRYTARMVKNVKIAPSPLWLRARLRAAGVRPINNIVDITNYVMLEYGQPMHAFDYKSLQSSHIIVRNAAPGEMVTTLDGVDHKLEPSMLVIADGNKPVALAGIMGGENSEISDDTTTVVFESANFNRENIRKTSRAVSLRTESSARFEKGLPAVLTLEAVERAIQLVVELGAGEPVEGTIDVVNCQIGGQTVDFYPEKINTLLGTILTRDEMLSLLAPLELFPVGENKLSVPAYRNDLLLSADVAEEVARLFGYDKIIETRFSGVVSEGKLSPVQVFRNLAANTLTGYGFSEVYTYSFISPRLYDKLRLPADSVLRESIKLINPLGEDKSVMRTHALPGMLESVAYNLSHRSSSAKLFELATVYAPASDSAAEVYSNEKKQIVLATWGEGDFYDLKGYVEGLLDALNVQEYGLSSVKDDPMFHPGRCAELTRGKSRLAIFGQVHPRTAENFDIHCPIYAAVLDLPALFDAHAVEKNYAPLPAFPALERDLALVTDLDLEAGTLCSAIAGYAGKSLESLRVFDVYTGKGVPEQKKSVAVRLTFRLPDRTMTDVDADKAVEKILRKLEQEKGITLRS